MNPSDSPSGDNESDFTGGVNDATPPTVADAPEYTGGVNSVEAAINEVPEYTGGVNSVEAAINEVPEYTGGVNSVEAAINEVPEYTGGVNSAEAAINEVPQYILTTAGTNKDSTYQAPAVKTEDKKELPNTGGKDNVAVASLGFLGLFLGAIPFVKRKN